MNILYSSSDSYAFLTGISLVSLLENNKNVNEINIYIMENGITPQNKEKLKEVVRNYRRSIAFFPMPDMQDMTGHILETYRWNISAFGRLYMASVLPNSVKKVLNIDCDTLVTDSLEDLWDIDMTGKLVGAMMECINKRYRQILGREDTDPYVNSGILVMNLEQMRREKFEEVFSGYISKYGNSLAYLDQDALNATVPTEKMLILPMRYNVLSIYFYATYQQVMKMRRADYFYSKEEFAAAKENPGLVHFTTCFLDGLRPWIKGNRHPYLQEFLKYKEMSPWKDVPLLEDTRTPLIKMRSKLIHVMPKWILCPVVSLLHGVIVPMRNGKRMRDMAVQNKQG